MNINHIIYLNIIISGITGKLYDDLVDISYFREKLNPNLKKVDWNIYRLTNLNIFILSIITKNVYLLFYFIFIFTIFTLINPKGFIHNNKDQSYIYLVIYLTLLTFIFLIINYKQLNIKFILMISAFIPFVYIIYMNESSMILKKFIKKNDKEISDFKIVIRTLGSLFLVCMILFCNKKIFYYFEIYDPKPLIAVNMIYIGITAYCMTSVIVQLYCKYNNITE